MPRKTRAQPRAAQLLSEGVDTVFALPGVQIMAAFDALFTLQDQIRFIQTRHGQATTYIADGYAKATGRVGIAMVVPGPGALTAAIRRAATLLAGSSRPAIIAGGGAVMPAWPWSWPSWSRHRL